MSNENEKCPKCGAKHELTTSAYVLWECGTLQYTVDTGLFAAGDLIEDETCLRRQLTAAKLRINDLGEAMREFCKRVEAGEVQSVRTYAKFKALLGDKEEPTDEH